MGKRDLGRRKEEWSLAVLQLSLIGFEMFELFLGLEIKTISWELCLTETVESGFGFVREHMAFRRIHIAFFSYFGTNLIKKF